jgi:hypothetical protein
MVEIWETWYKYGKVKDKHGENKLYIEEIWWKYGKHGGNM